MNSVLPHTILITKHQELFDLYSVLIYLLRKYVIENNSENTDVTICQ